MTEEVICLKKFEPFVLGFCKCGCGHQIPLYDPRRKKLRLFVNHHHMNGRKGDKNPMYGRRGNNTNRWQGGKFLDKNDYVLVYNPFHKFTNPKGYVREHRLVYEQYYKCCLLPYAIIHHINGIKNDNRIENLQILSKKSHNKIHCGNDPKTGRFIKKIIG